MPIRPGTHRIKQLTLKHNDSHASMYNYRWQKVRDLWLIDNPLCVHCLDNGIIMSANEVDHIVPHKGDLTLFWDHTNYQSLCKSCHSVKTRGENK